MRYQTNNKYKIKKKMHNIHNAEKYNNYNHKEMLLNLAHTYSPKFLIIYTLIRLELFIE